MAAETDPTPRRVVAGFALVGLLLLVGVVSLTNGLRLHAPVVADDEALAEPAADPLRDPVECALPVGREGVQRPETPTGPALPVPLTTAELLDCPGTWDGRLVQLRGEVVGEPLHRGTGSWLQVNDDAYALDLGPLPLHGDFRGGNGGMGVLVSRGQAATLEFTGRTGVRGDIVEVTGIFHRVYASRGEVAVIEGEDLRVLRRGFTFEPPPAGPRPYVAVVAASCALGLYVAERRVRPRR